MRSTRWSVRTALAVSLVTITMVATACQMAPPPGTSHSPSGSLDLVLAASPSPDDMGGFFAYVWVNGWASDWDTADPIMVMLAIIQNGKISWGWRVLPLLADTPGNVFPANLPRPDVDAAFGRGANFGFDANIIARPGSSTICAVALNVGPGDNTVLGCRTVVVRDPGQR